jgi:DNA-binding NarL/FixJ family response regulator
VQIFTEQGYEAREALTCADALAALEETRFDIVITELGFGDEPTDGLDILGIAMASVRAPSVIIATVWGSVAVTVTAMKGGAAHVMQKPYEIEELIAVVESELAQRSTDRRTQMVLGQSVELEEDDATEFKAIHGANPVNTIKNHADEYAVAYLNAGGGCILWGVRDARTVEGIPLAATDRDRLRRDVRSKLSEIQPPIDPSTIRLRFLPVTSAEAAPVENLFVVELVVIGSSRPKTLYWTGNNEAFVKLEGVKKKLTGPEIQEWIEHRSQRATRAKSTKRDRNERPHGPKR